MITEDLLGRITLKVLEFNNAEILQMLEDHDKLMGRVGEAVAVLRPHLVYEGVSRVSVSCQAALNEEESVESAEAHSMSKSSGRPPLKGSANDRGSSTTSQWRLGFS